MFYFRSLEFAAESVSRDAIPNFKQQELKVAFKVGDFVGVRCAVKPGPFDGERLIVIDTIDGPISGFIEESELRKSNETWEVRGKVQELNGSAMKVLIYGSFFTTIGIANIKTDLAIAA